MQMLLCWPEVYQTTWWAAPSRCVLLCCNLGNEGSCILARFARGSCCLPCCAG